MYFHTIPYLSVSHADELATNKKKTTKKRLSDWLEDRMNDFSVSRRKKCNPINIYIANRKENFVRIEIFSYRFT